MSIQLTSWTTTPWPSTISTRSVDASYTSGLLATLSEAAKSIETATDVGDLVSLSRVIRGAEASLAIISAENAIATATESSVKAAATKAIFASSVDLEGLFWEYSFFDFRLNRAANIIYLTLFGLLWLYYTSMFSVSRYQWFNVSFFCGYTLEFIGFIGRILAFVDATEINYFLLEFVSLTISPAFIMAGIYFTFGQLVATYGRKYSLLKPLWYTYIFISFDVTSLVIQAIGGGIASAESSENKDTSLGTNIMIAGIVFQVFSMSVFLILWFDFLLRIFFKPEGSPTRTPLSFFRLLFNTRVANQLKITHMDGSYNPKFADLRARPLVNFYPLAITIGTLAIYVRCIYRVVELAQGWSGYLISHEVYLMVLDAAMVAICGLVFTGFHPYFVFGKTNRLKVAHIRNEVDVHRDSQFDDENGLVKESIEKGESRIHDNDNELETL
ncbi:phospholipid-translocating ATPase rsb1 [Yamadazyma tenuis]|uniref:Sphingoid long-chain base transporter RSB1 n=1 Tax=Candida tenuis (strain ATCC 10573 / BCRC 21748 / CBS 615 / JCM 9827 / NBRC 10315 / NRRL Y-1498 / VKM Y-70) TaxID=590646 RepID=G3B2C4_CANTC|nr:RTA1-domain-containing protein [Yamadazyma tenuis ATCC 10573]EGV64644.1 RTA1-domain-containing protein [Yamadazyma tenuis ATCC 10573]WEJ97426.1 phospholipid-translocating ATPase rsb1 [Yamadazyma tenuis]